ncbi:MAG: DEAD/DEAH box helicase [Prevotella sp.]|nr:DEAD/DEAH box helicase [Prevotella sp.]
MNLQDILLKLGIDELNAMQQESYEAVAHSDKDVVILSPTGSGKTLAYLLPLVGLINADVDEVQAVVVVPGRELAMQSADVLKSMGTGLRACACYGGRMAMEEHRVLRQVLPHIVFATPGRLNDHLDKQNISPYHVRFVIIDEFDKCLEMGFQQEMSKVMHRFVHTPHRTLLLSATDAELIPQFVSMGRTTRVDFHDDEEQVPDRVEIYKVMSPQKDKLDTLRHLLLTLGDESSIVFLNYRDSVERVGSYLRSEGFSISTFHGGLEQKQREDSLYKFANGSANILVCTDLASRGLDIPEVANIINYHLPETEQNYVHRIGRTARWDKQGRAFFLLNSEETVPEYADVQPEPYSLPAVVNSKPALPRMVTIYIGKGKRDKLSRGDILGFLCKKGGLDGSQIGKITVADRYTYAAIERQQLKPLLQRVQGEKIKGLKTIIEEVR